MKKTIFAFLSILTLAGTASAQGWVPLTSGTTAGFNFISLLGRDTVYVSGDQILRSTDAGATWQYLPQLPRPSGRIQFVDDTTGFLSGTPDSVFRTTDGGVSWKAILGGSLPRAVFGSHNNGYVFGGEYTTDGGNSWHPSVGSSGGQYNCMIFADSIHAYAMGSSRDWNNGKPPAPNFERSSDGGATWEPIYPGPTTGVNGHAHSGIVNRAIYGIAAISVDTLIAVGDRVIARSLDGGNSWDTVHWEYTIEGLYGVDFPTEMSGTTVGGPGLIMHSLDGGQTWARQNSRVLIELNAVQFIDSLTGYTVGDNGTILKTVNGGFSWVNISPNTLTTIQAVLGPEPSNASAKLTYTLPEPQYVNLTIQNVAGGIAETILSETFQSSGIQTATINTGDLASGTYIYSLQTGKYSSTGTFQVIH